jgi:hypothetical protein
MTAIGHVRRSINLTIDGKEFHCEVTAVDLVPSVDTATSTVLCDDGTVTDAGTPSWSLSIDYNVDHNPASLFRTLLANVGKVAAFDYKPDPVNAPLTHYTGSARLIPGNAGGSAGAFESGSVSLPLIGAPTPVDDVAPVVADEPDPADVTP